MFLRSLSIFFLLLTACGPVSLHGAPVISEFLADNDLGLRDEDGEDQDWIEIHNPDATAVDLAGWRLTDDPANLAKWVFPSRILPPDGRIVVWASNKNRKPLAGNLHANFQLDQDGEYLALISPSGVPSTQFAPVFPFQTKNTSYGAGFTGAITTTVATPAAPVAGTHFNRIKLTGVGASAQDGTSLNVFDDGLSQPQHQQYLWFNYSSALTSLPAGQTVVDATLEWSGTARIFAGVSGLSTVPCSVGVFKPVDGVKGVTSIATAANGNDLIAYYAANTPSATVGINPGETKTFVWNVTALVKSWLASPASPGYGQFILVPSAHPAWIAWDQNRLGPRLTVRTSSLATSTVVTGHMSPSPGAANTGAVAAGPLVRELTENPPQPAPGVAFPITVRIQPLNGGAVVTTTLAYQKAYEGELTTPMNDAGTGADAVAGDSIYTGLIPAVSMVAGQMIRWRVIATDAAAYQTKMPPYRDTIDSPQYFGTVPVDASIQTNLFVAHWFMANFAAAKTTTGTRASVFLNGEFYDNVGINIHGQSTQGGAFLKKSFDVDGNRGYRFKWSADPAQPRAKDLNFLTIYGDKTKVRQDLAYEMNREAGVAAHMTFPVHVRLNGAFEGIYDYVEDGDDVYLERAGLNKDGVLYKMYNSMGSPANDAVTGVEKKARKLENNSDLYNFLQGMHLADTQARKCFLFDNVDVPRMINFMAANTVTGNVDLHAKNYYIYCDKGRTNLWTLLPWDLDLSQGRLWTSANNYFDDGIYLNAGGTLSGQGQNLVAKLYAYTEFANMAKRRMRTLHEKFFKQSAVVPDMTRWYDRRLSEMAALLGASIVTGQNDTPGMDAARDYAKFAAAAWKNPAPATTASPYASYTMSQELQRVLANWVVQRINTMYSDPNMPAAVNWATLQPLTFSAVEHSPATGDQDQEYIEINNPNSLAIDLSGWRIAGGVDFTFEPGTVILGSGKIYVAASRNAFKTRTTGPRGGQCLNVTGGFQGHLSNLGETLTLLDDAGAQRAAVTYPGSPSPHQQHLVVSEIMYHPSGSGLAEFVEITNTSPSTALSLVDVRFTSGITFDFTGSAVTSLAPGGRALVVRDPAAFEAQYGAGLPVAGAFTGATALNNGGETIKLEDPDNNTIAEFAYSPLAPWPSASGNGASIVLMRPDLHPDPANPLNWRASAAVGGNPGATDELRLANPAAAAAADADKDGLSGLVEYALGSSDSVPGGLRIDSTLGSEGGAAFLDVSFERQANADDAVVAVESSATLGGWSAAGWSLLSSVPTANGKVRDTWRMTGAAAEGRRVFVRAKVSARP